MKRQLGKVFSTLLALATITGAGAAFAGEASDLVKAKQTQLFKLLKAGDDKGVEGVFDEMLDYDAVVSGALGTAGDKCSPAEKTTISDDMKKLIKQAWKNNLKKTLDFNINYTGEDKSGDATVVKTDAVPQGGGDDVEIDYKLKQVGGKWKVQDISAEGVWTVGNTWKGSFQKIINDPSQGCAGLIKKLNDKIAKNNP